MRLSFLHALLSLTGATHQRRSVAMDDEMEEVLEALRQAPPKLREDQILELIPISHDRLRTILHGLLLRGRVTCDSFDPSKRGGQAGVRRWGVSSFEPLWSYDPTEKDESKTEQGDAADPRP